MTYKEKLESQIKEQYGKVVYTYTCHWQEISILRIINNSIKWGEIGLTAVSTTGVISYIVLNQKYLVVIGAVFSSLSLALTLFSKEFSVEEKISNHQKTSDDLWLIREKYISLLTDIEKISEKDICDKRDFLVSESYKIYKSALPTGRISYKKAQKELKNNQYQFFAREELNQMLPKHLRK